MYLCFILYYGPQKLWIPEAQDLNFSVQCNLAVFSESGLHFFLSFLEKVKDLLLFLSHLIFVLFLTSSSDKSVN